MPRKTFLRAPFPLLLRPASMRPRPDAAENGCPEAVAAGKFRRASMRPRPDAAENSVVICAPTGEVVLQ